MVICLWRGADLHMVQLMLLPLTVSCFSKIQIGFTFLVPAHLGSPGQRAVKRVCVVIVIVVAVAVVVNGYPYFHNFHRRSAVCRFCLSTYFSINSYSTFTSFRDVECLADDMCTTTA